ncbi:hypothetical protein Poli38472_008031 [Pythium oligandrum]|uniref:Uncharacterized protein n=1 Tax=Pythium oligandrum TaxID=41045 RepID=A0A8K1CLR4_PYTOL|nr:hypothetical protein Poli38472_008031 [Pythium oligandrum]|eukprot:TMW65389.1 hypothetical protein Poli38472_008031 [Pythium oligandrum]
MELNAPTSNALATEFAGKSLSLALTSPPTRQPIRKSKYAFVELSPWAFRCTWLGILALHGFCLQYFSIIARLYWYLPTSYLDVCLTFYSIGMKNTHYRLLSIVHWLFVSAHGLLVGFMVLGSLGQRRLVFYPFQDIDLAKKLGRKRKKRARQGKPSALSPRQQVQAIASKIYDAFYGRFGIFGVESPYFEVVILFRESTETILQSYQAYRMSLYVPRVWLNRFYVSLLVLNCWSTPLVLLMFKHRPMTQRLLCLLLDAVLDLFSSIGIPLILLLSYAKDYDTSYGGFDTYFWYDDVWFVNVLNEFQLLLVVSWTDLFSRIVFYIGFIGCMESIKDLLRQKPKAKRVGPTPGAVPSGPTLDALLPSINSSVDPDCIPVSRQNATDSLIIKSFASFRAQYSPWIRRLKQLIHVAFVLWGLAVMVLHLRAERHENLTQCLVQVRPWTTNKPACALLIMDCHMDDVSGLVDDITPQWDLADEATVTRILIRHCPQLHMPPKITTFPRLYAIKIYNSTVVEWGDEAALTNSHHSGFSSLLIVRTNFTDGQLPAGLLSSDFPQLLYDIEFQITNLHTLPDDLDTKWLWGSYLYFENCEFDHFPPPLSGLAPSQLSFAFNRFTSFPFEALQVKGLSYFNMAGNPISTLSKTPYENVVVTNSIVGLNLIRTNISYLPRWIDPYLKRVTTHKPLYVRDSPYCKHRNEMAVGNRSHFPEIDTMPAEELSYLMSLTAADLYALERKASCVFNDILFYPYDHEDEQYGLPQDPSP